MGLMGQYETKYKNLDEAKGDLGYDAVLNRVNAYERNREIRKELVKALDFLHTRVGPNETSFECGEPCPMCELIQRAKAEAE
jgi:hypothetical protein